MTLKIYRRSLAVPAVDRRHYALVLRAAVIWIAAVASAWPAVAQSPPLSLNRCHRLSFAEALPWGAPEFRDAANESTQVTQTVGLILESPRRMSMAGLTSGFTPVSYRGGSMPANLDQDRPSTTIMPAHLDSPRSRLGESAGLDRYLDHLKTSLESLLIAPTVEERTITDDLTLTSVMAQTAMGNGALAFGELSSSGDGESISTFLYYDDFGREQIFSTLSMDVPIRNFYLRTPSYLATIGDTGYVLLLDEQPALAEVRLGYNGMHKLESFPSGFRSRPSLENLPSLESRKATAVFKLLERTRMPTGIYGRGQYLYLLAKHAMTDDGDTAWWLIKLDPRNEGREISRRRLPTGAAHLAIVPGEGVWTAIEIGPVQGIGDTHAAFLETSSAVMVPSAWLEDPSNTQLDVESLTRHCARLSSGS